MPSSWILQCRLVLILVLLYGVEPQTTSSDVNSQTNNTDANSSHTEMTPPITTTAQITKTMVNHTSTMNINSIMLERDSFQEESDRLRVAVIILGVFFTLAAVAIITGLVWFFVFRRKSEALKGENQEQKRTAAEQKRETLPNKLPKPQANDNSANRNAQKKTDKPGEQQGKGPSNANSGSPSPASTSGDYEDQSHSADKAPPKAPRVVPKTKGWYANTSPDPPQSTASTDLDDREVYIELNEEKAMTDTRAGKLPTQAGSSQPQASSDEIYQNCPSETGEDYSQLDTETQYDHHYD